MSLGVGLVLIIEADGTVGSEIVGVAGFRRMESFDAVHSATGRHLSFAVEDQINLLGIFMMMRKIRAGGREVHQKKIGDRIGGVDTIAIGDPRPDQQFVENRSWMAADSLLRDLAQIGDLEGYGGAVVALSPEPWR